jgi:tRNA(Ile)-lysidine synthase
MTTLETKLDEFLHAKKLLAENKRLVLAVSGGVDSITMLELFRHLRDRWNLSLIVAHVNHQLRGYESDLDEEFVRAEASRHNLPFYTARVATEPFAHQHGYSKQVAARMLRYKFLEETRKQSQADSIATAHNANDNAETVLMNSLRGTGVRGLAGIPLQDVGRKLIRPMLFCYRKEIVEFAHQNSIRFREDSSNAINTYKRNYLRNVVLPELERRFDPNIVSALNAVSVSFRSLKSETDARVQDVFPSVVTELKKDRFSLDLTSLQGHSEFLRAEIVLELFRRIEVEPSAEKVNALLSLAKNQSGRALDLSKHWRAVTNRGAIVFIPVLALPGYSQNISIGQSVSNASFSIFVSEPMRREELQPIPSRDSAFVDADRLGRELKIRPWKAGDSFLPLGMQHRKKLSDFFVDNKIPVWKKHSIPLIESAGEIVWVCGLRLDDRYKISPRTNSVVKFTFINYVS